MAAMQKREGFVLLQLLDDFWHELGLFAFRNRTFFEVLFVCLYALEQIILILLIWFFPAYNTVSVSLFAVIVLSTFSAQKVVMEARIKLQEERLQSLSKAASVMEAQARRLADMKQMYVSAQGLEKFNKGNRRG
jgi:hypothetical protein